MRFNRTQAALETAADFRAYSAAIKSLELRERIPLIRNRRIAILAAFVAASPILLQRRRVRRDGRK